MAVLNPLGQLQIIKEYEIFLAKSDGIFISPLFQNRELFIMGGNLFAPDGFIRLQEQDKAFFAQWNLMKGMFIFFKVAIPNVIYSGFGRIEVFENIYRIGELQAVERDAKSTVTIIKRI